MILAKQLLDVSCVVFASEIKTLSERATWLRQMLADLLVHRGDVPCDWTVGFETLPGGARRCQCTLGHSEK